MEEQASQAREHRVSQILMKSRHRARLNAAAKSVPHYQLRALAQLRYETRDVREIVTSIGIAHQNVPSTRRPDSSHQSVSISRVGYADYACSITLRDLDGAI